MAEVVKVNLENLLIRGLMRPTRPDLNGNVILLCLGSETATGYEIASLTFVFDNHFHKLLAKKINFRILDNC